MGGKGVYAFGCPQQVRTNICKNSELSTHEQGFSTKVLLELLQLRQGECLWITITPLHVFFSPCMTGKWVPVGPLELTVSTSPKSLCLWRGGTWIISPLVVCVWKDERISNMNYTCNCSKDQSHLSSSATWLPGIHAESRGDQLIKYYNMSMIEVAALNGYIIQKDGIPPSERNKRDYLGFHYTLLEELIGSYSGRPHSLENQQALPPTNCWWF